MQKNEVGPFILFTKINSKCIKDPDLRANTVTFLEKNYGCDD